MITDRELIQAIRSEKREYKFFEENYFGGIIIPYIMLNKYDLYIYGCGNEISNLLSFIKYVNIELKGVIDKDKNKQGSKTIFGNYPVMSIDDINESDNVFIVIYTSKFKEMEQSLITSLLHSKRIYKYYFLTDHDRKVINAYLPQWESIYANRIDYYKSHEAELLSTYNLLKDDISKEIMIEYIRTFVELGTYRLEQGDNKQKYFAGYNRDTGEVEELYVHLPQEVWINCGACLGDNVFWYIANGYDAQMIKAYEGDAYNYSKLCTNLELLPDRYRDKVEAINCFIDENWSASI